jgi:hypothetical protein
MLVTAQLKWSEAPMRYGDDEGSQAPEEPEDFRTSLGDRAQLSGAGPGFAHRAQRHRAWSGPLPSPDILGEYERQLPGAAERILAFAMRLTTAMITVSAIFFSLAVARVGSTSAAMVGGSVFLSVPVIMLFRAFITRR